MYNLRKITPIVLLAFAIIPGCKKSGTNIVTNPKDAVDSIVGVYVGDLTYHSSNTPVPGGGGSLFSIDTTIRNDTIYVMKKSASSFCYYGSSKYGPGLSCEEHNASNIYKNIIIITQFLPQKSSMYYSVRYGYTSGASGVFNESITFNGKK